MPQIKDLAFWNKKCQVIPSPKNLHFFFNTWDKLNRRKEKEQSCCLRKTVPMESANKRVDSSEGHKNLHLSYEKRKKGKGPNLVVKHLVVTWKKKKVEESSRRKEKNV